MKNYKRLLWLLVSFLVLNATNLVHSLPDENLPQNGGGRGEVVSHQSAGGHSSGMVNGEQNAVDGADIGDDADMRNLEQGEVDYVKKVMTIYGTPHPFSRIVKNDDRRGGTLMSTDKSMQSVLDYVFTALERQAGDEELKGFAKTKVPKNGCFLTFSVEKEDINAKAFLFDVGTMVDEKVVEKMEIFEERETGRKAIREKRAKISMKKGHLMGTKKDAKKEKAEKRRRRREEEEEGWGEGEEEDVVKLATYSIIRALQQGRRGFGPDARLHWSNLPQDDGLKHPKLMASIEEFFQKIIDVCDEKEEEHILEIEQAAAGGHEEKRKEKQFDIAEFFARIKSSQGKMKTAEDLDEFDNALGQMHARILQKVRQLPSEERGKYRQQAANLLAEFRQQNDERDEGRREKVANRRMHPYDFMRTVRYGIGVRPPFKEFKRMSDDHFDALLKLAAKKEVAVEPMLGAGQELSALHRTIADEIIHAKRDWRVKLKDVGSSIGRWVGNGVIGALRALKIIRPQDDDTSAEREKKEKARAKMAKKLDKKRREVLAEAVQKIRNNQECMALKGPIEKAVYDSGKMAKEPHMDDLHARLGAQALNSVLNTKRYPEGHSMAMSMSIGGSGLLGILLDVAIVPLIVLGMSGVLGSIPLLGSALLLLVKYLLDPLLESTTPLIAETYDSAVVTQYLDSLSGKKFWRGIKHFRKVLKESLLAGRVAGLGSVLYNFSLISHAAWMLPVQFVANVLATVTSAASIAFELTKTRDNTMKALHIMMEREFFPKATRKFKQELAEEMGKAMEKGNKHFWAKMFGKPVKKLQPDEARNAGYVDWIEREAWRTMEIEQSSRLAINSMGIGPLLSSIIFAMMEAFTRTVSGAPETVNAMSVMFNSPTELISLMGAIIGANNLGFEKYPWLLSTDEQKNAQLIGEIFRRSREQLATNKFVEIANGRLHAIYNPKLGLTMPMGRFFANSGIFLKAKWDKFVQRKEYKMKKLAWINSDDGKKRGTLIKYHKKGMVYLVTLPRVSSAQSLSPKGLALEAWLKFRGIPFYRISDGIFMRHLFSESVPFIEYNGKKITGTVGAIIKRLMEEMGDEYKGANRDEIGNGEMKKIEETLIKPLERAILADRSEGLHFFVYDRGLTVEMISTMSQLYPKLVEYEADYVETWDTLPWQLKCAYDIIKRQAQNVVKGFDELHYIEQLIEKIDAYTASTKHKFLACNEPTYVDAILLGLLVQIFETPLNSVPIGAIEKMKGNLHLYQQFYLPMMRQLGLVAELKQSWTLNYDILPNIGKIDETYNGPFRFDFEINHQKMGEVRARNLKAFADVHHIFGEPQVDIEAIKAGMRAQKVPHEWLGSMWKVTKKWTDGEFERVLEENVEQEKREVYMRNVHEHLTKNYPPVLDAIVDKLMDAIWDGAGMVLPEFEDTAQQQYIANELEDASQQLSLAVHLLIAEYMEEEGQRAVVEEMQRNEMEFRRNKANEIYEKRTRETILEQIDQFFDDNFLKSVMAMFEEAAEDGGGGEGGNGAPAENSDGLEQHAKQKNLRDQSLVVLSRLSGKPTIEVVNERINGIFNKEIGMLLANEIGQMQKKKLIGQIVYRITPALKDPAVEKAGMGKCIRRIVDTQREAIAFIQANCKKIGREKSWQALIQRLYRTQQRFIKLRELIAEKCIKSIAKIAQSEREHFLRELADAFDPDTWSIPTKLEQAQKALKEKIDKLERRRTATLDQIRHMFVVNEKGRQLVVDAVNAVPLNPQHGGGTAVVAAGGRGGAGQTIMPLKLVVILEKLCEWHGTNGDDVNCDLELLRKRVMEDKEFMAIIKWRQQRKLAEGDIRRIECAIQQLVPNLGETLQKKKVADMLQMSGCFTAEVTEAYGEEITRRTVEKMKQTKFPIVKAVLHLAAHYLCEGEECGIAHRLHASQALRKLHNFDNNDIDKFIMAVHKFVYAAISDFNENFLIREEILSQYGMHFREEIEREENEKAFWDIDSWGGALSPDDGEEEDRGAKNDEQQHDGTTAH